MSITIYMDLLKKHGMEKCDTISTPMATTKLDADLQGTQVDQTKYRSMIKGLMYLTAIRPDIAFATSVSNSILRCRPCRVVNDDCKSTSRGIQFLVDKLVSWSLKKQDYTAMSTMEVEYASLSACCAQVIWMRTQLLDYGFLYNKIPMYYDSQSAIAISCNPYSTWLNRLFQLINSYLSSEALGDVTTMLCFRVFHVLLNARLLKKILLDHSLNYALTTTADVPAIYLQQFWQIVHKVPNTKDTIRFKLATQKITYKVDMFRATLKLPVETLDNAFVALATIEIIESFMNKVGYQGVVDKLMIDDLMKKFLNIPQRIDEDYHSIKDDVSLVSVYTTGNVLVRGMLIPDEFLTEEIHVTNDFKKYETVFVGFDVPINQQQPVVSTQGMHSSTPRAHRTPTVTAASP
ncbi:hypothetical protein Tco_0349381 [Tanacetum coccineum]